MNTTKKLHIGMMATMAAVAVLTGCQRREEGDTTTVTPPPASTAPAPSTAPGTSGYTGPATGDTSSSSSSSTMSPPAGSAADSAGAPGASSSSSSSTADTPSPGTSGYTGPQSGSGADANVSDQDRQRSGTSGSSDMAPSGSGTSGSSSGATSNTGPTSSLDRPFRDVAVATPGAARGPAAWREVLGVQVVRVDADKAMDKTGKSMKSSDAGMQGGKLSKKDEAFIKKAATGGMFEVEAARLAAEKASDPQLKTFAEKLRDHHQQANDELKQIASARGVSMPTQLQSKDKAMLDKLNKASGDKFDKEFISMVGLRDHKQDIRDFENARNETSDPDLKAWIEKTLPTLRTHLAEAQQMSDHPGMKMQGYTGQEGQQQNPTSQPFGDDKGVGGSGAGRSGN